MAAMTDQFVTASATWKSKRKRRKVEVMPGVTRRSVTCHLSTTRIGVGGAIAVRVRRQSGDPRGVVRGTLADRWLATILDRPVHVLDRRRESDPVAILAMTRMNCTWLWHALRLLETRSPCSAAARLRLSHRGSAQSLLASVQSTEAGACTHDDAMRLKTGT